MSQSATALAGGDSARDTGAHPAQPLFWARRGAGHAPLQATAWLHAAAGAVAALSCLALWYHAGATSPTSPISHSLLELAVAGGVVACTGLLAVLLTLPRAAAPALVARVLLPAVDLAAAWAAYWLLGARGLVLPLFLVPAAIACVLLSWRGGVVFAALAQASYCTLAALRMGPSLDAWVPQTLVLAGLLVVQTGCLGRYVARLEEVTSALQQRLAALRRDRAARAAEQTRLLDGLTLMEETQARLEQERVRINAQIVTLAAAAQRLAEGDPTGVRSLAPGMYGPLALLASALGRLAVSPAATATAATGVVVRPVPTAPPVVLPIALPAPAPAPAAAASSASAALSAELAESLGAALREQGRLLAAADALLRDLGIRANELMAAAQAVREEVSDPYAHPHPRPNDDRGDTLSAALRDIERLAQEQSAGAATLGSRLAQLLVRQSDLDTALRRAPLASDPASTSATNAVKNAATDAAASGVTPLWPPASSAATSSGAGAGASSARHASVWDTPPAVARVASGPLR